jgi:hypothetical protein
MCTSLIMLVPAMSQLTSITPQPCSDAAPPLYIIPSARDRLQPVITVDFDHNTALLGRSTTFVYHPFGEDRPSGYSAQWQRQKNGSYLRESVIIESRPDVEAICERASSNSRLDVLCSSTWSTVHENPQRYSHVGLLFYRVSRCGRRPTSTSTSVCFPPKAHEAFECTYSFE